MLRLGPRRSETVDRVSDKTDCPVPKAGQHLRRDIGNTQDLSVVLVVGRNLTVDCAGERSRSGHR